MCLYCKDTGTAVDLFISALAHCTVWRYGSYLALNKNTSYNIKLYVELKGKNTFFFSFLSSFLSFSLPLPHIHYIEVNDQFLAM